MTSMEITVQSGASGPGGGPGSPAAAVVNRGASYVTASSQVAVRTLKKFVRTPALIVAGTAQGILFLLIFRYVFEIGRAHV